MSKMEMEIQTVRNVKIIILFFVGTLYNNLHAQDRFDGMYCKEYDLKDFSRCLTFERERSFMYEYSGDTGVFEFGKGEYQLIDNRLILNYNKTEPIKIGHHVSKIWTNSKDSINLKFNVFDFDGLPLHGVTVVYKDSLSKYGYSGVASNENGVALLHLKIDRTDLQVKISNVGFRSYEFSLDKNYNYNISVFMQKDGDGEPIRNQIDTIRIEKIRNKYFTEKNAEGKIVTWRKIED